MMHEISLKLISEVNDGREPLIENVEWFINKNCNANENDIGKIIRNYINIQTSLAYLHPYQNKYNSVGCQTVTGFLENEDFSLQLEAIKSVYSKVLLMRCENSFYLCRVSEPFAEVLSIFDNLYQEDKLNKYLSHFCLKPFVNDCTVKKAYRFTLDKNSVHLKLLIKELKNDIFINYLLNDTDRYIIQCKALPINGFTLDDIENDIYIQAFSRLVNTLYIRILEDDINNTACFTKDLVWD